MNFFKALSFITISMIKNTSGLGEQAKNINNERSYLQFNDSTKGRGLRGLASTTAPSASPTVESPLDNNNEYPTASPTPPTPNWMVGLTHTNIVGTNAFFGKTEVQNGIGWSVPPSNVSLSCTTLIAKIKKSHQALR